MPRGVNKYVNMEQHTVKVYIKYATLHLVVLTVI
jgi:hypothetical protein